MEKKRQGLRKSKPIQNSKGPWRAPIDETKGPEEETVLEKEILREEAEPVRPKVKFEVYGEEMIEKEVKYSGNSGRVYLPPEWIGKQIKVIRTN